MMNLSGRNYSSAFTQIQWQELELQALIYKYMVSGIPIPLDLIYSLKRSLDSSLSSSLFPHHPIGWGCFEMGFGKKCDPEPGRCRRTDGKKWRCSKEAYPDSKYCEKHMHRGRNRSRKPVEVTSAASRTTTTTTTTTTTNSAASTRNFPTNISFSQVYHPSSSSSSIPISRPPDFSYTSSQTTTSSALFSQLLLYSGSNKDYRDVNEKKEGLDHERAFFPDSLGSSMVAPLSMGTYNKEEQQPHCFVLGADFKSQAQMKNEKPAEIQKPLHHFFEEWPIKSTESWLDLSSTPNC